MIACFDSDVLIDYLNGLSGAAEEMSRYQGLAISRIAWMEVLTGVPPDGAQDDREDILRYFSIIELDEKIAREAILLRRKYRLKLPDAIIWASARIHGSLLITRNTKDFPARDPGIRIPYRA